jgi:hypothetical protein
MASAQYLSAVDLDKIAPSLSLSTALQPAIPPWGPRTGGAREDRTDSPETQKESDASKNRPGNSIFMAGQSTSSEMEMSEQYFSQLRRFMKLTIERGELYHSGGLPDGGHSEASWRGARYLWRSVVEGGESLSRSYD